MSEKSGSENEGGGHTAQIEALVERAYAAEGLEKVTLLEEAIRLADLANDAEQGMELRDAVVDAATWAGYYERSLVAFSWMLAKFDADPDAFGHLEHHLLWYYKWIMDDMHLFPQISRAQVEQTFADMERRYAAGGFTLRAVHKLRGLAAADMGHADEAKRLVELWRTGEEDELGDCEACEVNGLVTYLLQTGDDAAAFEAAKPVVAGKVRCKEVPALTYSRLLVPMLKAGRADEAKAYQKKSWRQMNETRKAVPELAEHLLYFSLTGEPTKAAKLLETRLPWALETRKRHDTYLFLLAAEAFLRRLAKAGRPTVKLRLPKEFSGYRDDDAYETAALADAFRAEAAAIAAQFDRRNGNDAYARRMGRVEELVGMA